jgi:hypothetical protein
MDFEFKEFNIQDMYNDMSKCKACTEGLLCMDHKYEKNHEFIEMKKKPSKQIPKNKV